MDIFDLRELIATALEVEEDQVLTESQIGSIEEWDSLGHISILSRLDLAYDNITERVPDLASCTTVIEIHKLLEQNGL
jgi:acyl carrier protein